MKYQTIQPPPSLARYVRFFWVFEGEATDAEPYVYRGYADGCAELVFHYQSRFDLIKPDSTREDSFSAGIHAQTRTFSRNIVHRDFGISGCYLYPFALPRIFGFPASDLTGQMTDFASVIGREGAELEDKMLSAVDNAGRVAILTRFLERRLLRDNRELPYIFSSIDYIIKMRGLVDIGDLAKSYNLSDRQFERKFKEFGGFTPKTYSRIIRFQSALKEYGNEKISLTDIAYDCGYYDQSHFINDFKEFSGYSPKVYFSGKAEGSEYLEA